MKMTSRYINKGDRGYFPKERDLGGLVLVVLLFLIAPILAGLGCPLVTWIVNLTFGN